MNRALFKPIVVPRVLSTIAVVALAVLLGACASANIPLISQPDRGVAGPATVAGRVLDDRGAVISDATVVMTGSSFRRTVKTDVAGKFTFERVPLGKFVVAASATGLKGAKQQIEVTEEKVARLELKLKL